MPQLAEAEVDDELAVELQILVRNEVNDEMV